jgi:transposase
LSTKSHLAADADGHPVRFLLTGGEAHDATQAIALLEGLRPSHVIADKAYDSRHIVDYVERRSAVAVIPSRSYYKTPRPYCKVTYQCRNSIERCFNRLKHFRRIATRYDRKARHFLAFLYLATLALCA